MRYRSNLEKQFHKANQSFEYENTEFEYTITHKYIPDFYDPINDVYYETKGYFTSKDRSKMLEVIKQNPGIKIVLVFQNPNLKLSKTSKTTYADWADKHNIEWCTFK